MQTWILAGLLAAPNAPAPEPPPAKVTVAGATGDYEAVWGGATPFIFSLGPGGAYSTFFVDRFWHGSWRLGEGTIYVEEYPADAGPPASVRWSVRLTRDRAGRVVRKGYKVP